MKKLSLIIFSFFLLGTLPALAENTYIKLTPKVYENNRINQQNSDLNVWKGSYSLVYIYDKNNPNNVFKMYARYPFSVNPSPPYGFCDGSIIWGCHDNLINAFSGIDTFLPIGNYRVITCTYPNSVCGTGKSMTTCQTTCPFYSDYVDFDVSAPVSPPALKIIPNLTFASSSNITASVGTLFTDLWGITAILSGLPLAFFAIRKTIRLF